MRPFGPAPSALPHASPHQAIPAMSQMFGGQQRDLQQSAATKAHSIAAEPVLRASHGPSPNTVGVPARPRLTAGLAVLATSAPSKWSWVPRRQIDPGDEGMAGAAPQGTDHRSATK